MDQSFPPAQRFHTGRDFGRVFHRQQKAAGRWIVVLVSPRPKRGPRRSRLGVMVSTKVAKSAVRRHTLKRWARELYRRELKQTLHGHDALVLFRSDPGADQHAAFDTELRKLVPKALAAEAKPGSKARRR